jgi:hypothetical protein
LFLLLGELDLLPLGILKLGLDAAALARERFGICKPCAVQFRNESGLPPLKEKA